MDNKEENTAPKIKIKREKRRLYELPDESTDVEQGTDASSSESAVNTAHATNAADVTDTENLKSTAQENTEETKKTEKTKAAKKEKTKKPSKKKVNIQDGVINQRGQHFQKAATEADKIIHRYVLLGGASGFIPIPILDLVSTASLQIAMVKRLSEVYEITFREHEGRAFILSLLASVASTTAPRGAVGSLLKSVPGVGTILGACVMPGVCAATTFALGKVFVHHFESGGTFLTLKPNKSKPIFDEAFKKAKKADK